jgi:ParB-like chromosome segregation protein Spo0J
MKIRDRIRELRRVRAGQLRPNPKNWRTHPEKQRDALRGVLSEIGYADALLARELDDGSLELIDGHLRAETTPDAEVPVLVLDLSEAEADKLLATLDPLAGMAETDGSMLAELLPLIKTENAALQTMLDELTTDLPDDAGMVEPAGPEIEIPRSYQLLVECQDEKQQRELYERLIGEGRSCRVLTV